MIDFYYWTSFSALGDVSTLIQGITPSVRLITPPQDLGHNPVLKLKLKNDLEFFDLKNICEQLKFRCI